MPEENIRVEMKGEFTKVLTLDRPDCANALNAVLVRAFADEVAASYSDETKILIIKGEGRHFCSGFDRNVAEPDRCMLGVEIESALQLLADAPFVTIAHVRGSAIGGGADIAVACDYRCADDGAMFSFPGFRLIGVSLGNSRLARCVGSDQAMSLILQAKRVDSADALRMGLVTDVCDDQGFAIFVGELQAALAGISRPTLRTIKQSIRQATGLAMRTKAGIHQMIGAS